MSYVALRSRRGIDLMMGLAFGVALLLSRSDAVAGVSTAELEAKAGRGDATAQFNLAQLYDTAEANRRHAARAFDLYCQAANKGHAAAAFRIGRIFFTGRGKRRDIVRAAAWFRLAAERGHLLSVRLVPHFDGSASSQPSGCGGLGPRAKKGLASKGEVATPPGIAALVAALAPEYGLDPNFVLAIIAVESAFQRGAISPRRALGLMQLMPETAARFGVRRVFDPEDNIRGGMSYLRWLSDNFDGDRVLVLAAYNAGEGAVERYGGVPPFPETKTYIEKIRRVYGDALLSPVTTAQR
jgi:soluble lytic murein transglycosylase-like protein